MSRRIIVETVVKEFARPRPSVRSLVQALRQGSADERNKLRALDGVSFSVEEGERLGIIGPNGAGKSTLLHLITGIAQPSSGRVEVTGRVNAILTLGAVLRDEVTGRDNIYLDGEIQGRSRAEMDSLTEKIIAFSELGDFIDMPVRTYSSGMRARLAFSLVAFIEPEILILDEILSVGDARFSRKATQRMAEVAQTGKIVLFVSHGMKSVVDLCTRCIWLDRGRIVMDGDPRIVTEAYGAAVKAQDEAALRRRFGAAAAEEESAAERLAELSIEQGDDRPGVLLAAGQDAVLRISGSGEGLRSPDLRLRVLRIDGTVIAEECFSRRRDASPLFRRFTVAVRMRPLVLNASIYRAEVELCDGERIVARRSAVFEVAADSAQIGGVPMLLYPCKVTARAVEEKAAT